ncbi:MAG: hypothetical protein RIC14_10405 [Filomicrobium sp.]
MTGTPQYTAAQLLDIASRYELEGNLDYASQFYNYLADSMPGTPEATEARAALQRLANRQAAASAPRPTLQTPSASTAAPQRAGEPSLGQRLEQAQQRLSLTSVGQPQNQSNPAAPTSAAPRPQPGLSGRAEPNLSTGGQPPQQRDSAEPGFANRPAAPQAAPTHSPQQPSTFAQPAGQPPATTGHNTKSNLASQTADDNTPMPRVIRGEEEELEEGGEFAPGYRVGRFLAFTMVLIGWLALIAGIAFAALAVAGVAGSQIQANYGGLPFGVAAGLATFTSGLIMIFVGSMAQATFEAANNTRELLEIERAKAGW